MENTWVSIDGEEYTYAETLRLIDLGMVERCYDFECPHEYHKRHEYSDAELIATLERIGYRD